jgi:cell division protein FtsB
VSETEGDSATGTDLVRSRRLRIASMPVGMIMLFALVASLFVFPVRTWLHQRNLLADRQAEYAAYEDIVENLQDQVNYLQSPAGLRDAIRTQLGYLAPDEKRVPLMEAPELSAAFPERWPYTIVSTMMLVRTLQATEDAARNQISLTPLLP